MRADRNGLCPCGSGRKFKHCCAPAGIPAVVQRDVAPAGPGAAAAQGFHSAVECFQTGQLDQAEALLRRVLQTQPNHADALHLLGMIAFRNRHIDVAIDLIERAIRLNGSVATYHNNLGLALQFRGRRDQAVACYTQAIGLDPRFADPYHNRGLALQALGRVDESVVDYQRALALKPDYAVGHHNLASALQAQQRLTDAIAHYQRAISLKPDYAEAYVSLGNACYERGDVGVAIARYRQALALRPNFVLAHQNLLLVLNYSEDHTAQQVYEEHLRFARLHEEPLRSTIEPHGNDRTPGRRLRIGYVSPDFRTHSVAFFIEPVLEHHERDRFEVFCYYSNTLADAVTERLRSRADGWRIIAGRSDAEVARQIRADRIDILVDLAGHTAMSRVLVLARKPAPVQVTWLGYPNTTGLSSVDYRITDMFADPPGTSEHLHVERLVRLPGSFSCYLPPNDAPDVAGLPTRKAGCITFGSFNAPAKISARSIGLFAEVLRAVPGSRLMLKNNALHETATRETMIQAFLRVGVAPDRLMLLGRDPSHGRHLAHYNDVDIALDTVPYNGATTTCDALWMGVPVVTLAGATHVGRVGVSQMSNLGLTDLIARTPQEYSAIAARLAGDPRALAALRAVLRPRMASSVLTDARSFTRHLEWACRAMWKEWCGGR